MSEYDYLLKGSFLRAIDDTPKVSVQDDRVVILAGARHLALTADAAWELLASLSAALNEAVAE
jgi:hypothetical protein